MTCQSHEWERRCLQSGTTELVREGAAVATMGMWQWSQRMAAKPQLLCHPASAATNSRQSGIPAGMTGSGGRVCAGRPIVLHAAPTVGGSSRSAGTSSGWAPLRNCREQYACKSLATLAQTTHCRRLQAVSWHLQQLGGAVQEARKHGGRGVAGPHVRCSPLCACGGAVGWH